MTILTDKKPQELKEGIDYNVDANGNWVFTREYLTKRGHCCESGCQNCPYDYSSKVDPEYPSELQDPWADESEAYEIYDGDIDPDAWSS